MKIIRNNNDDRNKNAFSPLPPLLFLVWGCLLSHSCFNIAPTRAWSAGSAGSSSFKKNCVDDSRYRDPTDARAHHRYAAPKPGRSRFPSGVCKDSRALSSLFRDDDGSRPDPRGAASRRRAAAAAASGDGGDGPEDPRPHDGKPKRRVAMPLKLRSWGRRMRSVTKRRTLILSVSLLAVAWSRIGPLSARADGGGGIIVPPARSSSSSAATANDRDDPSFSCSSRPILASSSSAVGAAAGAHLLFRSRRRTAALAAGAVHHRDGDAATAVASRWWWDAEAGVPPAAAAAGRVALFGGGRHRRRRDREEEAAAAVVADGWAETMMIVNGTGGGDDDAPPPPGAGSSSPALLIEERGAGDPSPEDEEEDDGDDGIATSDQERREFLIALCREAEGDFETKDDDGEFVDMRLEEELMMEEIETLEMLKKDGMMPLAASNKLAEHQAEEEEEEEELSAGELEVEDVVVLAEMKIETELMKESDRAMQEFENEALVMSASDEKYPKERAPIFDPVERAKVSAKYAAIEPLEDRAFQILLDLKMI